MNSGVLLLAAVALLLSSSGLSAQIDNSSPLPVKALEEKYSELASRYQERCTSGDTKIEGNLLLIERGAGLQEGVAFPVTMQLVSVIRDLQKDMTNDMCERASDYADLSKLVHHIIEDQRSNSR